MFCLLYCVIPDLNSPVGTASDEDFRMIGVPRHFVDCHVMGINGIQELCRVGFRALVYFTLFSADQEHIIRLRVEVERRATA